MHMIPQDRGDMLKKKAKGIGHALETGNKKQKTLFADKFMKSVLSKQEAE